MYKVALPVLVLAIFGLFLWPVVSPPPPDTPPNLVTLRTAEPQQPKPSASTEAPKPSAAVAEPKPVAAAEAPKPDSEPQPGKAIEDIRAELARLSGEIKANSDKIAQAATLRSDLQESKSSSDKADQSLREQVDALRSDQAKIANDAKEAGDKTAQALRQELAASQAKLASQIDDAVKADTARSEALAQRVDAMKKDLDEVKKNLDEDRRNASSISPALVLVIALLALFVGPYLAHQFSKNQFAAATRQRAADASAAEQPPPARTRETNSPRVPPAVAEPYASPPSGEDTRPDRDPTTHQHAAPDSEKV